MTQHNNQSGRRPSASGPAAKKAKQSKQKKQVKSQVHTAQHLRGTAQQEHAAVRRRITRGEMRRRRAHRRLMAVLGLLALIFLGIVLSVTVLFKVSDYQIENIDGGETLDTGIYTTDQILTALNVSLGENLFQFSIRNKEEDLELELPYLETVEVRRKLPGTVVIRVEPAAERYKIPCAGGWTIISEGLKVLKVQPEEPQGLLAITGVEAIHPAAGKPLVLDELPDAEPESEVPAESAGSGAESAEQKKTDPAPTEEPTEEPDDPTPNMTLMLRLLNELAEGDVLQQVNSLHLGAEIDFIYQNRARVLLGSVSSLEYKMKWARYILLNENGDGLAPDEQAIIDISHVRADGSIQPLLSPGSLDIPLPPEPTPVPTPTPAPPPEEQPSQEAQPEGEQQTNE